MINSSFIFSSVKLNKSNECERQFHLRGTGPTPPKSELETKNRLEDPLSSAERLIWATRGWVVGKTRTGQWGGKKGKKSSPIPPSQSHSRAYYYHHPFVVFSLFWSTGNLCGGENIAWGKFFIMRCHLGNRITLWVLSHCFTTLKIILNLKGTSKY